MVNQKGNVSTMILKRIVFISLLIILIVFNSCKKNETAVDILDQTINSIDTIESIYYKQDMERTNPRQVTDTISRFREMYFKRLISDSIVGVKGHWYMYIDDKENVIFEDIYDGKRLVRKNNRDSVAKLYDLEKYPGFKRNPFWGHRTLYSLQYSFRYMLDNTDSYKISRKNDTIFMEKPCYQLEIMLEDKMTMPGFGTKLEDNEGSVSRTIFFIEKETYYPIRMKGENFSRENPGQKYFIEQRYYDIRFNNEIDEDIQFNTSDESLHGFQVDEIES